MIFPVLEPKSFVRILAAITDLYKALRVYRLFSFFAEIPAYFALECESYSQFTRAIAFYKVSSPFSALKTEKKHLEQIFKFTCRCIEDVLPS